MAGTLDPDGPGLSLVAVSFLFLILSCCFVTVRATVRLRIRAFGVDDVFMVTGLAFFIVACIASVSGSYHGIGSSSDHLSSYYAAEGRKWFFIFQLFYAFSIMSIRISICTALLRFSTGRTIRAILYTVILISTLFGAVFIIVTGSECSPFSGGGEEDYGRCEDSKRVSVVSSMTAIIYVLTDITCATLPAFILRGVHLQDTAKKPVIFVLALGILASIATIIRIPYILRDNGDDGYLRSIAYIAIWSIVECGLGMCAGSLAALRPILRYIPELRARLGISENASAKHPRHHSDYSSYDSHSDLDSPRLAALRFHRGLMHLESGGASTPSLFPAAYILKEERVDVMSETAVSVELGPHAGARPFGLAAMARAGRTKRMWSSPL